VMCRDHRLEPLPSWLLAELAQLAVLARCFPVLGVHEHCEHDPDYRAPRFHELTTWRGVA
jgi:hypothetical protein